MKRVDDFRLALVFRVLRGDGLIQFLHCRLLFQEGGLEGIVTLATYETPHTEDETQECQRG